MKEKKSNTKNRKNVEDRQSEGDLQIDKRDVKANQLRKKDIRRTSKKIELERRKRKG